MSDFKRLNGRERFLAYALLGILGVFIFKLFRLQVVEYDMWACIAEDQEFDQRYQKPARGEIRDRNGRPIAISLPLSYVIAYRPNDHVPKDRLASDVAEILGKDRKQIRERLNAQRCVNIAYNVDETTKNRLSSLGYTCLVFDEEPRRVYPGGSQASALVGFCDVDGVGREGLEAALDTLLMGTGYKETVQLDAIRAVAAPTTRDAEQDYVGASVHLTIDLQLQTIVEDNLKETLEGRQFERACAILIDPHTGDILALATFPSYDLNQPASVKGRERQCWPVADVYEPGSTFKFLPVSLALETGRVSRTSRIDCENGSYRVRGATIHDAHAYAVLSMDEVLAYSSNIGAAKIGQRFKPAELYDKIRAFGFGNPTYIEIPNEQAGFVPLPRHWSGPTLANLCYGQGISCTALQLAMAYAAIANGGMLMKPRVVQDIYYEDGTTIPVQTEAIRRVLEPNVAMELTAMLEQVTEYGTAKNVQVEGVRIAAKTGTAQKVDRAHRRYFKDRYVSSLVGFFPADNPRYTLLILVDDPRGQYYGATVAGPAFKGIVEAIAVARFEPSFQNDRPHDPNTESMTTQPSVRLARRELLPVRAPASSEALSSPLQEGTTDTTRVIVPAIEGLPFRQAFTELSRRGLGYQVSGSRRVVSQYPSAGTWAAKGTVCRVQGLAN